LLSYSQSVTASLQDVAMPNYKLHYFNFKARGELARIIFAAADVKFEDHRIEYADWPNHKSKYRFQQVPVLEIDGVQLNQSVAICHYLGRQFNLAGKTILDDAQCLALVEQIKDLFDGIVDFSFREKDETRKAEKKKEFETVTLKNSLTALEAYFKENMSASGYIVGNDLTWADLAVFNGFEQLNLYLGGTEDRIAAYPTLVKHRTAIGNLPRIKKYLETRPKTAM